MHVCTINNICLIPVYVCPRLENIYLLAFLFEMPVICDCDISWPYSFVPEILLTTLTYYQLVECAGPEEWTGCPDPSPLENHKPIAFLSNTGQGPLGNHKAIMPAFNVGLLSAPSKTTFEWCFASRLMMARFSVIWILHHPTLID